MKRFSRDEPVQDVIHMCMEAMLESLCIALYFKLAKMLCLSYYHLCLLLNKIGEEGRAGSAWKQGGEGEKRGRARGRDGQTMYAHMNK
jgi:hypothetical protein